jgi:hypothetical protein
VTGTGTWVFTFADDDTAYIADLAYDWGLGFQVAVLEHMGSDRASRRAGSSRGRDTVLSTGAKARRVPRVVPPSCLPRPHSIVSLARSRPTAFHRRSHRTAASTMYHGQQHDRTAATAKLKSALDEIGRALTLTGGPVSAQPAQRIRGFLPARRGQTRTHGR